MRKAFKVGDIVEIKDFSYSLLVYCCDPNYPKLYAGGLFSTHPHALDRFTVVDLQRHRMNPKLMHELYRGKRHTVTVVSEHGDIIVRTQRKYLRRVA